MKMGSPFMAYFTRLLPGKVGELVVTEPVGEALGIMLLNNKVVLLERIAAAFWVQSTVGLPPRGPSPAQVDAGIVEVDVGQSGCRSEGKSGPCRWARRGNLHRGVERGARKGYVDHKKGTSR